MTQLPFQVLVTEPPAKGGYKSAAWLAREKASGRVFHWATIGSGVVLAATLVISFLLLGKAA